MRDQVCNTVMLPVEEYEALRKDAERYRWLRRDDLEYNECAHIFDSHCLEELDAALDARLASERERCATLLEKSSVSKTRAKIVAEIRSLT